MSNDFKYRYLKMPHFKTSDWDIKNSVNANLLKFYPFKDRKERSSKTTKRSMMAKPSIRIHYSQRCTENSGSVYWHNLIRNQKTACKSTQIRITNFPVIEFSFQKLSTVISLGIHSRSRRVIFAESNLPDSDSLIQIQVFGNIPIHTQDLLEPPWMNFKL